jgi:hypothetical protein
MGITIMSLRSMLVPLQNLVARFAGTATHAHGISSTSSIAVDARRGCSVSPALARRRFARPGHALRVVRVLDGNHAARGAGRMVISGRMVDVCAELERLAALEAAAG